eukprot:TRINITY_DN12420_c0_g1_i1.p1 TRINITY_DN12420_c0_g1~~TRINITY_DN12420_c0_g1_i1.p1  ORF type:complete len:372 (+),score=85.59 TRINITY_DN12420_c0_g1_i1:39-1154(+)
MRRAGASSSSGDADSLQTFIRRAASQVQRWNNAAREYEKKVKRSKQLALESGVILAELSGLDESNPDDIATARRLVQKLETANLIEPKDVPSLDEFDGIGENFFENTQAEEKPKQDVSAANKKRKRESEPKPSSISAISKNDDMDIEIEQDELASLSAHDDQMMLESSPSNLPPVQTPIRTPAKPQRPPASPKRTAAAAAAAAPASSNDSESNQISPPPSKKAKNSDTPASGPTEAASAKKSAAVDVSPAAKKATSTMKALAAAKKTAPAPEPPAAAPVVVQRGMLDTFADRKSVRTLRGRDSTLQACHKQKPRCIAFSPTVQDTFATSALDGTICFWKKRDNASGNEKKCEEFGYLDRAKLSHSRFPADI